MTIPSMSWDFLKQYGLLLGFLAAAALIIAIRQWRAYVHQDATPHPTIITNGKTHYATPALDIPAVRTPSNCLVRTPTDPELGHVLARVREETTIVHQQWDAEAHSFHQEMREIEHTYNHLVALEADIKRLREQYETRRHTYRLITTQIVPQQK